MLTKSLKSVTLIECNHVGPVPCNYYKIDINHLTSHDGVDNGYGCRQDRTLFLICILLVIFRNIIKEYFLCIQVCPWTADLYFTVVRWLYFNTIRYSTGSAVSAGSAGWILVGNVL